MLFKWFALDTNLYVNSWNCRLVIFHVFAIYGLQQFNEEQSYCGNCEILRCAVGQYNVLQTLPHKSVVLTCLVLFLVHYFHWNDHSPCIFVLKGTDFKLKSLVQVQYNESLANFACSSSTEEYWPSVVFVRTSGKCSLVWPSGLGRSYYLWL